MVGTVWAVAFSAMRVFSRKFLRKLGGSGGFWFSTYVLTISVLTAWWCYAFRDELLGEPAGLTATVRNVGLVSAGLIALGLAVWRSLVAKRQADIAARSLLYERYQRAIELLASDKRHIRIGAIFALRELSLSNQEELANAVSALLMHFAVSVAARRRFLKARTATHETIEEQLEEEVYDELSQFVEPTPLSVDCSLDYVLAFGTTRELLLVLRDRNLISEEMYKMRFEATERLQESWFHENLKE